MSGCRYAVGEDWFNVKDLKSILHIIFIIEALTEEEKEKLAKIKKKMKRKVSWLHMGKLKGSKISFHFLFVSSDLNIRSCRFN